jgi:hypothetical protein
MVGAPRALAVSHRAAPSCTVSVSPRVAPCRAAVQRESCARRGR